MDEMCCGGAGLGPPGWARPIAGGPPGVAGRGRTVTSHEVVVDLGGQSLASQDVVWPTEVAALARGINKSLALKPRPVMAIGGWQLAIIARGWGHVGVSRISGIQRIWARTAERRRARRVPHVERLWWRVAVSQLHS